MFSRVNTVACGVAIAIFSIVVVACSDLPQYSCFAHVQQDGWDKADTTQLKMFVVPEDGIYRLNLGLRTTEQYPFTELYLRIGWKTLPNNIFSSKSLRCSLLEKDGETVEQRGVVHYQYDIPFCNVEFQKGDTVLFYICHSMKREILPGVTDVGLTLLRQ